MLRLFNKFLPIVIGILTAAIFAACSDDSTLDDKDPVRLENGLYQSDTHPYGMCFLSNPNGPVICGPYYFYTEGIISFDKNADSYVLTPVIISEMPVEKLKPFASAPILLPNEIVEKLDTSKNTVTIVYEQNFIESTVINGHTYQSVNFSADEYGSPRSRSSENICEECATPDTCILSPAPEFLLSRSSDSSPIFVKVYYHAVRSTSGSGITDKENSASKVMNQLSEYFSKANIYFGLAGTEYLDCISNLTNSSLASMTALFSMNSHSDGIDIYELSDCKKDGYFGLAQYIGGKAVIIAPISIRRPTTVAHEVGHCLGLYHTHRGSKYTYEIGVAEYVDGSNSTIAGDSISDTPADPGKWKANGEYQGGCTDPKGMPYNPDPSILMSYSALRNRFTDLQIARMMYYLNGELNDLVCVPEMSKVPFSHFHNNLTLSVKNAVYGFTASWKVKRYASSNSEDQTPTLYETTQTGNNCTLSTTTDDYFEIELTYSNNEITLKEYVNLTANAPSPYTGTLIWETNTGSSGGTTNQAHGESLTIGNNSVTLNLSYLDKAGAILQNLGYRAVTATNRLLEGSTMTVTKADCARGYLKVRMTDACGTWGSYFTIPVTIIGGYYAMNVDTASDRITLSSESGASPSGKTAVKAKAPAIGTIIIYDSTGKTVATLNGNAASTADISTAGWPKGEYRAEVSDGADYNQTILFAL